MKRFSCLVMVAVALVCSMAVESEAQWRPLQRMRANFQSKGLVFPNRVRILQSSNCGQQVATAGDANAQQAAQQEADYMAANNIRGHVGGQIGSFEGVGWTDGGGEVPTCTPDRPMKLVADAQTCNENGCFRVRGWY